MHGAWGAQVGRIAYGSVDSFRERISGRHLPVVGWPMDAISPVPSDERDAAIATVVAAFAADPVERWLWPEANLYESTFPGFVAAFGGQAFEHEGAWGLADTSAVALWLAPGVESEEEKVVGILSETVAQDKHDDLFSLLEQMTDAHPTYPHWYLPWLAVAPDHQGRGLGAQLLKHGLAIVDAHGLPAFLETPNPRTVPLYERHGFEVVAKPQAGTCPPMTSMLRPATG
jgi:GNAT superfamily N-acetyltransferase